MSLPAKPPGWLEELADLTGDAVVLVVDDRVSEWNRAASDLFGSPLLAAAAAGGSQLGETMTALRSAPADGRPVRRQLPAYGDLEIRHRKIGSGHLFVVRDVTAEVRRSAGLRTLSGLSTGLLGDRTPSVAAVLQAVASEAKAMTAAAYSAVMLLRPGSRSEASHFVYDAPRELFPEQMPRFLGLLAVPIDTRRAVRVVDCAEHPAAVGLPGAHPPLGALCAVPLLAGSDVLGLLAVARPPAENPFDAVDEELLVDLAGHTAAAVRWAQGAEREEARLRLRADVVSTARHDIRTPLGAGKGYARLLRTRRDEMNPEQVHTALLGLEQSIDRIEEMTDRLLVDEQLESGGSSPHWELVDLTALIEEVCRDCEVVAGRPHPVVAQFGPDAPRQLAGDAGMIREVLDNLVGNALKHGGPAGTVTVSVRSEGETVRIDVRDQGPGIAEADQSLLFQRWSRTSTTRQSGTSGFGLGLSIVKRLVGAHGGVVGVSSRPGEGATFWVTFPAALPRPHG